MKGYLKEFWTDRRVLFLSTMEIIYFCVTLITPGNQWTWAAIGVGMLFFFFVEYVSHRFFLHGTLAKTMPKAHAGHELHHEQPNNFAYMLTPNQYSVPLHLLFWGIFSAAVFNIHLGSAIMLGTGGYQLYYEWSHYVSHHPIKPLTPWGRWMKKYHLLHHFKDAETWYGVTNSALDRMLGTSTPAPTAAQPGKSANNKSQPL